MPDAAAAPARRCAFCDVVAGAAPAHVVADEPHALAFLDHKPLFHGHVLVVVRSHVTTLAELPATDVGALFATVRLVDRAVERATGADGSMVLVNNVVSQSVPHLHVHAIPRRRRDGLRFWLGPRRPYDDDAHAAAVAAAIAAAYAAERSSTA